MVSSTVVVAVVYKSQVGNFDPMAMQQGPWHFHSHDSLSWRHAASFMHQPPPVSVIRNALILRKVPLGLGGLVDLLAGLVAELLRLVLGLNAGLLGVEAGLLALDLSLLGSNASGFFGFGGGLLCSGVSHDWEPDSEPADSIGRSSGRRRRTTSLHALHNLIRHGPVSGLDGILGGVDGALLEANRRAEEAGVAGESLTVHDGGVAIGAFFLRVNVICSLMM